MSKAIKIIGALSVTALLLIALVVVVAGGDSPYIGVAQGATYNTLRVYGHRHEGAGDPIPDDPVTDQTPEDPPYTEHMPIFNPQVLQAPRKDSVTWNPLFMSEFETFDENHAHELYHRISAGPRNPNATEKVWFRLWYEPWHWDKDLNSSGYLDIVPELQVPYTETLRDEWYPAVMQEFTYMLLEPRLLADVPHVLAGPAGQTSFVFPVGMREEDLFTPGGNVDMSSENALYGYGLTSLDGDFDGVPDIVHVQSESTLPGLTGVNIDFNGTPGMQPLDPDSTPLSGDEMAVFHLDTKSRGVGQALQFLDHMVIVKAVFDTGAQLEVWYTGDKIPDYLETRTVAVGQVLRSGRNSVDIDTGSTGDFAKGPWFAYLEGIDLAEDRARLVVGRALGAPYSAMEDGTGVEDLRPGDPWFLKRLYVDGHEYNVVAIMTKNEDEFEFITIRTPIPKTGEYDDPRVGHLIEQHSVTLQPYPAVDWLSVMPPYNYEHYIILDVQAIDGWTCLEEDVAYMGNLEGPVPPILQVNGPDPYIPYRKPGTTPPTYSDEREMYLFYIEEDKNWQFLGELKEKYGEGEGQVDEEFWYVEQWHTLPWEYTEFVLPDLSNRPDLYLLTSAFLARQSEYVLWTQDVITNSTNVYNLSWDGDAACWVRDGDRTNSVGVTHPEMPDGWSPRAKFWFDPEEGGKKYKSDQGVRLYGFDSEGPGDRTVDDPGTSVTYTVEIWPYTDPWAPFNPQLPQAPPKDSLTFNPAYMDKYYHGDEPLADLYRKLSINGRDAREKVFLRMWYEPDYLDKILTVDPVAPYTPTSVYTFPAVMQEFTYMYLNTLDQPAAALAGSSSKFAFPMATAADELPAPVNGELPAHLLPSFGFGLTSFDANFDGSPDIVQVHSELSLSTLTAIGADFDGNGFLRPLDWDGSPLSGDELVVFALEEKLLSVGDSVQFLDHMITLDNVSTVSPLAGTADLQFWYTGGGWHPEPGGQCSLRPDKLGPPRSLAADEMAIVDRSGVRRIIPAGGSNLSSVDGAWFAFVRAVNTGNETASVIVGRALGDTHSAMDNGLGSHDLVPGDPWYLKRFFVDGHEYNVVAVHIVPVGEEQGFKYITIRTPVPKENFVNYEDSQKLEGYFIGTVWGVDTSYISVMPPFNFEHTCAEDIQALPEKDTYGTSEEFVFGNDHFWDDDCRGDLLKNKPPYLIRIVEEEREPQFWGELKEKYRYLAERIGAEEQWSTEQWHTMPDQYTELQLPAGQLYLLTSDWSSDQSRAAYYGCHPSYESQSDLNGAHAAIPDVNTILTESHQEFATASEKYPQRVKFLYDPQDSKDIYVNTWSGPGPTPTPTPTLIPGGVGVITGTIKLQGRGPLHGTDYSGALVEATGVTTTDTTTTDASGCFALSDLPGGPYDVTAAMGGYLDAVETGVDVYGGTATGLPAWKLLGGDALYDCVVNVFDLVTVTSQYDSAPYPGSFADINGSGIIDIFDVVMVGINLDKTCGPPVAASSMAKAWTAASTGLRVIPSRQLGEVGEVLTVTLELEDVSDLYGVDVRLTFDPNLVEALQIEPGTVPDPMQGQVTKQMVDNDQGVVAYAISLVTPAAPAEDDGTVCTITFRTKALGISRLEISSAVLSDSDADPIPVLKTDGWIRVGSEHLTHLPIIIRHHRR